jgi:C4-dicarboxylate transporter, DctM subunit
MSSLYVALISILAIVISVYLGFHVAIALCGISLLSVFFLRGDFSVATSLFVTTAVDSISNYVLGVIPLFVLMGMLVTEADIAKDSYEVANRMFRRLKGGLGVATVFANTVFAAVTGVSIASAAVFTRVSLPEMLRFGYTKRFAVGVVAGSSVLGMLIPPSVLLIIYALLAEVSVGTMFIAGIVPGLLLSACFCLMIIFAAYVKPEIIYVDGKHNSGALLEDEAGKGLLWMLMKITPAFFLIAMVIGGIYGGIFTPTEAGAAGVFITMVIGVVRRKIKWRNVWEMVKETGSITATVLILVFAATLYTRMLGLSGLPTQLGEWVSNQNLSLWVIMLVFLIIVLILGTIIDSISIILITVPLFLPLLKPMGVDLVWFGIITVIAVEIGLLTPPFGISVFVVKSSLQDKSITLRDIFIGSAPFAVTMALVVGLLMIFPILTTILIR